jgi:fructokinase
MTFPVVLCIGEILYDRIADQPSTTIAAVQSWTDYAGGAPANVACALVKLGTPTGFIGAVGQDDRGDQLVTLLTEVGVDTSGIQRVAAAPTRTVLVLRSQSGDRSFAAFGDHHPTHEFADTKLAVELLPHELFLQAQYLVLGTLEMAYPKSQATIKAALELAKNHHVKIILDVNWRPVFWENEAVARPIIFNLIKQADYLKLSDEESQWLWKTTDPSLISAQFPNLKAVLITAGEQGCQYWWAGKSGQLAAFSVPVIDTTGAGDSFLAGFVHQLVQLGDRAREQMPEIIRYASAAGALTTMQTGAIVAQPNAPQVIDFLQQFEAIKN